MARVRISKKDLKQDEVRHFGEVALDYIKKHERNILIGLVIIVVLLAGYKIYSIQRQKALRESNVLFSEASNAFQMGVVATEPEQMQEKMEEARSVAERVVREYGGSPLAINALYLQGSAAFFKANNAEDYNEPIRIFREFIDRSGDPVQKAVGYVALGYSYENKYFLTENKDLLDEAINAYEQAIDLAEGKAPAAQGKLAKARLLELQYKDQQAALLYESVQQERKIDPDIAAAGDVEYRDPQMSYMKQQLETMQDILSFSSQAEVALDRLKGLD